MTKKIILRVTVLVLALAFVVIGIALGEPMEVLQKARMVCFSCIGIC